MVANQEENLPGDWFSAQGLTTFLASRTPDASRDAAYLLGFLESWRRPLPQAVTAQPNGAQGNDPLALLVELRRRLGDSYPLLLRGHNLHEPETVETVSGGLLLFGSENQYLCQWALVPPLADARQSFVMISCDGEDHPVWRWAFEAHDLFEFFIAHILDRARLERGAASRELTDASLAYLRAQLPSLGLAPCTHFFAWSGVAAVTWHSIGGAFVAIGRHHPEPGKQRWPPYLSILAQEESDAARAADVVTDLIGPE